VTRGHAERIRVFPPTKKPFKVDLIEVARWQDGKIKDLWPFINGSQLAGQLGLMPASPPPAK
jgi:hypothetical protein